MLWRVSEIGRFHIMRHATGEKNQIWNLEYQSITQARFTENGGKATGKE